MTRFLVLTKLIPLRFAETKPNFLASIRDLVIIIGSLGFEVAFEAVSLIERELLLGGGII